MNAMAADGMPRCVLVVDDDPTSQVILKAILRRLGFDEVTTARDGDEAVAAFRNARFDLVLMDSLMPGTDGFEATRLIRELEAATGRPRVPIIGTSAQQDDAMVQRAEAAGMSDMLHKPVDVEAVRATLARWIVPGS
jgi:CheY-like chemotaxis protein